MKRKESGGDFGTIILKNFRLTSPDENKMENIDLCLIIEFVRIPDILTKPSWNSSEI